MSAKPVWLHPASLDEETLARECAFGKGRSGGPGGQHRNKVETKVTVTHTPTGLSAVASERRSAKENRHVAIKRLRLLLATEHRTGVPPGEIGSPLWKSRRQAPKKQPPPKKKAVTPETIGLPAPNPAGSGGRIVCNPDHWDYAALLAEAMDAIADAGWDLERAATRLDVSKSQLLKLIREHAPALVKLNEERAKLGKHPMK